MSGNTRVQLHAVAWGLFSSAVFSVPVAVVVGIFDRDGTNGSAIITILKLGLLLVSAAFAGYAAGRTAGDGYGVNGALAGAVTFVLVQITYSVAKGSFANPLAFVTAFFLGACLGTLGGLFASRRASVIARQRERSEIEEHDR